jgi:hypothetical protein
MLCGIAFVGLRNAFPSVDHDILLEKLRHYGVRGKVLAWLSAYLRERTLYVSVAGRNSHTVTIGRGVPQGSPLGPLLFSIYYSDIVSVGIEKLSLFADDTQLHAYGSSADQVIANLNNALVDLRRYMMANKLELNSKKTVWMLNFSDATTAHDAIKYGDETIKRVSEFKYLGFIIDEKLSWQPQVNAVIKSVKRRLYCLYRSKFSMTVSGRRLLLNALILPYFQYGIELWFACNRTLRGSLEVLLRHCLRVVLNDTGTIPTLNTLFLYISLDIMPLSLQFQLKLGMLIYKVLRCSSCPAIERLFLSYIRTNDSRANVRRSILPFNVPMLRLEGSRARLAYYGCLLWNHLSPDLRNVRTETAFRLNYRQYLFDWLVCANAEFCTTKFYEFV